MPHLRGASRPLLVAASLLFPVANIPDSEAITVTANALFVVALWPLAITWLRQPRASADRGARIESEATQDQRAPPDGSRKRTWWFAQRAV